MRIEFEKKSPPVPCNYFKKGGKEKSFFFFDTPLRGRPFLKCYEITRRAAAALENLFSFFFFFKNFFCYCAVYIKSRRVFFFILSRHLNEWELNVYIFRKQDGHVQCRKETCPDTQGCYVVLQQSNKSPKCCQSCKGMDKCELYTQRRKCFNFLKKKKKRLFLYLEANGHYVVLLLFEKTTLT